MRLAAALLVVAGIAGAADVAGLWKASYRMPDGSPHESTLDLQVAGEKLTGKITSRRGTVAIEEGTVKGNDVRFTVLRRGNGDEIRVEFVGRIQGDTMRLTMKYRDRDAVEITARRAS
jgi:hypothetical protein